MERGERGRFNWRVWRLPKKMGIQRRSGLRGIPGFSVKPETDLRRRKEW
jgi:hypothetical protein